MIYNEPYTYKDFTKSDVSPLILAINTLGKNLIGLELGVCMADSFLTIMHNCNIKKLYGIDHWKPYDDYLKYIPDGKPQYSVDEKKSQYHKLLALHNIKYSGSKNKSVIIEEDTLKAVKKFYDGTLDFIFFDSTLSEQQTYKEAMAYYPKIKKGGLLIGHDAEATIQVIEPLKKVLKHYKNTNQLFTYNNCFLIKI